MSFIECTTEKLVTAYTKKQRECVIIAWKKCAHTTKLEGGDILGEWYQADVIWFKNDNTKMGFGCENATYDGMLDWIENTTGELDYATI